MAFELPRLPMIGLTDEQLQIYWQQIVEAIEAEFNAQQTAIDALNAAVAAQAAADAAQASANTVKRDDAISGSWISPSTVLSATDNGTDATIAIAAHTRHYGDNSSVSVNGGSLTGNYSTTYDIYYTQTSRAGGSVSYQKTTNPNTALPNAAAGRHWVGTITTPASGGGGTSGGGGFGGGSGYGGGGVIP